MLVAIKATAFNPIDYKMRRGDNESKLLTSAVLGRELAGIVLKVGKQVTDYKVGDSIAAYVGSLSSNGTYAEQISLPRQLAAKIPSSLSYAQAAALPLAGLTALQCFERLNIPVHEPVFIAGGAGGVGTVLIKLLLEAGHQMIITTAGNNETRKHLLDMGISEKNIIDYKDPDLVAILKSKTLTGYYRFWVDLVGGKISDTCATVLNVYGVYADVTNLTNESSRGMLFNKAATIVNIANYANTLTGIKEDLTVYSRQLILLFDKIISGQISPSPIKIIGGLSVETVSLAHTIMEQNNTRGKKLIMITNN